MTDALRIVAPANLAALVKAAFTRAATNGDLTYYQTQVALLAATPQPHPASSTPTQTSSPPFQLRFSPALASKPKNPKPHTPTTTSGEEGEEKEEKTKTKKQTPFNPFAKPDPALVISRLGQQHTLVLNKFAIVPGHFLVITNSFKPQTHLLEADDLEAAYACVRAYHEDAAGGGGAAAAAARQQVTGQTSSELFVFFNSGPFSGASQPHRHLQLLPVESMKIGLPAPSATTTTATTRSDAGTSNEWAPLVDTLHRPTPTLKTGQADVSGPYGGSLVVPFKIFSAPITPQMSAADRHAAYIGLYREACEAVRAHEAAHGHVPADSSSAEDQASTRTTASVGDGTAHQGQEAQISYNLAMTNTVMALCPRLAEGTVIHNDEGAPIGKMELNGTVLAGTALVKSEAEWDAVRKNPALLQKVLEKIGIPTQALRDTHVDKIRDTSL